MELKETVIFINCCVWRLKRLPFLLNDWKKEVYTSSCTQNELLKVMDLEVLREIAPKLSFLACNGLWDNRCIQQETSHLVPPLGNRRFASSERFSWPIHCLFKFYQGYSYKSIPDPWEAVVYVMMKQPLWVAVSNKSMALNFLHTAMATLLNRP